MKKNKTEKVTIKGRRLTPDQMLAEKKHFENLMIHYGDLIKDKNRAILQMYYREDYSLSEIAEEVGISQAQVSRLEKLALKQMKRYV